MSVSSEKVKHEHKDYGCLLYVVPGQSPKRAIENAASEEEA